MVRRLKSGAPAESRPQGFADAAKAAGLSEPLDEPLGKARAAFRLALTAQVCGMANSLVSEWRAAGLRILGLGSESFDEDTEAQIRSITRALDGDADVAYGLAKAILDDERVELDIKVAAAALVFSQESELLRAHIDTPRSGPGEDELLETLEGMDHGTARALRKELEQISSSSPYDTVKTAAILILESIGEYAVES
ncbi:MAG: hypothetical protein AB1529_08545 [Candidatus Micrarchaeota archaeon]